MKRFGINVSKYNEILRGERPVTDPVGVTRGAHGHFYNIFISTLEGSDTQEVSKAGNTMFNIRKQRRRQNG